MKNFIQPGNVVTLISPIDLNSGDPILIGKFFGVLNRDTGAGLPTELSIVGVYSLPKAPTVVFAQGALVYWNPAAGNVTSVTTAMVLIGAATNAAASADLRVEVRLNGVATPAPGA